MFSTMFTGQMGCTASCKSCEGVAQNYSVDIGAPDEKDPDEVNEENEGEENPAELYKDVFFFWWRGVMGLAKKDSRKMGGIYLLSNF